MKSACFWSTLALVAIILCLETVEGKLMYKTNEAGGNRRIHTRLCGDTIVKQYRKLCPRRDRNRRSALMDEQEALSFLQFRSRRSATDGSGDNGPTNIVEECCIEACAREEILEYC